MNVRSKYDIQFERDGGGFLIYNTLTGAVTALNSDEENLIEQVLGGVISDPGTIKVLKDQGHIVDSDELEKILEKRDESISSREKLEIVILTTMDCNFNCPYCFEEKRKERLSPETAERILKFIKNESPRYRKCNICWFGGEPLLNPEPIIRITEAINDFSKNSECEFTYHITTNGYLLDRYAEKFVDMNIKDYMITIDGIKEDHDRCRTLIGNKPTYDRIISNIKEIASHPGVIVSLRINFNRYNSHNLKTLFDEFDVSIRNRICIVIEPIFGEGCSSACDTMSEVEIYGYMSEMYKLAKDMGYATSCSDISIKPRKGVYCYAERLGQIIFSPKGCIFKCAVQNFHPEDSMGTINEDGTVEYNEKYHKWMDYGRNFANICSHCSYLPICMGSCRAKNQILLTAGKKECLQQDIWHERIKENMVALGYDLK